MIDFLSTLIKIKKSIGHNNFENIQIYFQNPSLEYEFYNNLIAGKTEWFDILQNNNIFDFKSFTEQVEENGQIINIPWEPFFYLQSVFSQIPDKVIPIFKVIMEKHLKKQPVNISWYVSRILTVLSENINNLTSKNIMVVIEPFKYLIPEGRPFYEVKLLAPILEKLLETGQDKFVEQILTRILMVSGYKTEDKTKEITFASWQDYYYFLEIIEKTELEKKYPTFCFQAFVNVLCSIYEQFPLYTGLDIYGMNYLTKQDKAYLHPELLVINKILSFADKIHGEDLTKFYNRLQKLDNIVTIQNILCYFADVHNDLNIAAKFLLKFADYNCYPYFGTSDYINLAFKKFDKLSLEQRESILDKRNEYYLDLVKKQKELDTQANIRLIQNCFVPFRKGLTPKYQKLYGNELSDADINDYIDDGNDKITIKTWGENQSVLSKDEIESKNISEILECIKYFKEPDNAYFQDKPSIQGTAELISKYINKNKELLKDIELFEDASIHPQYHYSLVFNMEFNKDENITIENIRHFISYMDWISKQSNNTFIDTKTKMFLVQDYYQTCMWIPRKIQEIIANYDLENNDFYNYSFNVEGFPSGAIDFLSVAMSYAKDGKPGGSQSQSRRVGFVGNVSYSFEDRYFVDASFRTDGSSLYGADRRFAPFWSTGVGWNIHRENFMQNVLFIDRLKIRGSIGETGSNNFSAYEAVSTYAYNLNDRYYQWMGANLRALANPKLEWQKTMKYNAGVELNLFNSRVSIIGDIYLERTNSLMSSLELPPSNGFSSYKANIGKLENKGFELKATAFILRDTEKELIWSVTGYLVHNKDKILELSKAMKESNEALLATGGSVPNKVWQEGDSQNAIYVVPSLGIDPSTGKELYLKKNGEVTYTWSARDRVFSGVDQPKYRGNLNTMFRWKDLSVNMSFGYEWGGQTYNETLINRVENADKKYNVDERVYEDRWKQPGDVTFFKGINVTTSTQATSRFVQDEATFSCQNINITYEFRDNKWLKHNLGLQNLTLQGNMADIFRISTIKQERGTSYPFSRQFSFSLSAMF